MPTNAEPFQSPAMPVSSAMVVDDLNGVLVLSTLAPRMDDASSPDGSAPR